jgi:hypothetical protein
MSNEGGRGKYIIFSAENPDGRKSLGWLLVGRKQILKCILGCMGVDLIPVVQDGLCGGFLSIR